MTGLARLPDWQVRLRRWLTGAAGRPIVPGQWDCCLFAAGAVEAQTGVDLAADWRGRYSTFAGGRRILRRAGYADHVALIAAHLPEAPVNMALPGDIAIVPGEEGDAGGVVQGAGVYVLSRSGRLGVVPMTPTLRLFKLGIG
ncbi:DUF6950 family protein [Ruixingdingia sedimenti]|uniref:DUF6950 domain-containing protein n=1 Tax=Ruixingdingia sedimenti TaxID=3073604 RepID=A0ABU1FEN6_9RHOB|nr:hypothetical protein [Xinfangfangia sp. LG-4]MDR5655368.1 hypothetical protein [Xinfangfangia sp. LG-4]